MSKLVSRLMSGWEARFGRGYRECFEGTCDIFIGEGANEFNRRDVFSGAPPPNSTPAEVMPLREGTSRSGGGLEEGPPVPRVTGGHFPLLPPEVTQSG